MGKLSSPLRPFLVAAAILSLATAAVLTTSRLAFAAIPFAVSFDFDTGLPSLSEGRGTPFNQTSGGVTAYFSSPSDPAAFSVQSGRKTFFKLSQLSGKYLYDNNPIRDSLEIRFSQDLTSLTFSFATIEYHGGAGDEPSNITLTAYMNSTAAPVGSAVAHGTWPSGDSYPQGVLLFDSGGVSFNLVRIELPYQSPKGAVDFLVDNVIITPASAVDVTKPVPDAGFDQTVYEDVLVTFDGSASTDNVAVTSYTWTFTDGTTKTLSGSRPSYTFGSPGFFTVVLNVTDASGNWASDSVVIEVRDVTRPVADAGQDRTANAGEALSFDAGASTDNVGIVSYGWDYGDGTTGNGTSSAHTYANPGNYTVTLTVKDAAGNVATDSVTVQVASAFPLATVLAIGVIGIGATAILLFRKQIFSRTRR